MFEQIKNFVFGFITEVIKMKHYFYITNAMIEIGLIQKVELQFYHLWTLKQKC